MTSSPAYSEASANRKSRRRTDLGVRRLRLHSQQFTAGRANHQLLNNARLITDVSLPVIHDLPWRQVVAMYRHGDARPPIPP